MERRAASFARFAEHADAADCLREAERLRQEATNTESA